MDAVIRQVHFAYRPEEDGWRGGHSTYEVKATPQGLTLTPVRYKNPEPEALEAHPTLSGELPPAPEAETGAPLFLGPARVKRGEVLLSVATPRGEVASDGHLSFVHGAVVEHLRNSEQGVEQSWSFEGRPGGGGDLRVHVPVKGYVHTGTSEQGVHFEDARTGFRFRYSHGTWVDANGRRTAVPAEYSDGHIQLRVPEEVLASSAYPAVLDPVVTQEMIIDGRLVAADAVVRTHPAMAFNGKSYLLVWRGTRGNWSDIYATRVSDTGTVLDPSGIVVSNGPGSKADPAVASNGTDFQVVWSQLHGEHWAIRGTRVTGSGEVSDPGGIRMSSSAKTESLPKVASNGMDYLVVWQRYKTSLDADVYAQRVSSTGQPMAPGALALASGDYVESAPSVASNGSVYLVAWSDERSGVARIYATRISNDGEPRDGTGFLLSIDSFQFAPAVASNGVDFFVAWTDYRNSGTSDVYGTHVTDAAVVVDGAGLVIASNSARNELHAAVAAHGASYFVAWTLWDTSNSTFQVLGSRIWPTPTGVMEPASLVLSPVGGNRRPTVAAGAAGWFVAWESVSGSTSDLQSAWVGASGNVTAGRGFPVTTVSSLYQTEPAVASNGSNYLVVWTETGSSSMQIYGARVSLQGGTIDMTGLQIASAIRERRSPAVASNGTDYFVTWMDYRDINWDIYGARVLGTGSNSSAVLEPSGIPISTHAAFQNVPAVASNGTDYFVVWRQDGGDNRGDIHGARVSSAGVVQDPSGIALATQTVEHYTPRVASNGSSYLAVWAEEQRATGWDILGVRVSPEGVVLDASAIPISDHPSVQFEPDVASDGTDYFIAWTDHRSGTNHDTYGARVSGEGIVLDTAGLALCTDPVQQYSPKVAFDGANYVAAWADYRWDTYWDVLATQVTSAGTVVTPDGFSVVYNARETEPFISLASAGNQQSLVVFSRHDTEPNQGSRRVRGSFFSF
ncbi:MAG: hypothetical protein JXB05_36940 [Myxococcaceae bacterium]|nr:hypothetical protein [Myxococcaceae bacterium]